MSVRPNTFQLDAADSGLAAVRHRAGCLARSLRLPGTAAAPDCLSIRYWHRPDSATPAASPSRAPVLLVHGYASTEHMWRQLRAALAGAGFDHVIALRYNTFRADIHRVADWLVEQADRTMTACGADGVHLIGHSMGGLVVRDAVQARGLGDRARTAVTLATPHHGSPFARFVPGPCARQMLPGSDFLRSLAARRRHGSTRWIDIEGDGDRVVAAGPAPTETEVVRVRHPSGHCSITRHPEVVARIVDELIGADERTADQFSLAA
ncbi:MAG TPA: alpha/beta fold hydrolase [Nakamurella sp.]|jgi:triacylglycerol esterase/lipase EstA (alpha/beta hydrolase family)